VGDGVSANLALLLQDLMHIFGWENSVAVRAGNRWWRGPDARNPLIGGRFQFLEVGVVFDRDLALIKLRPSTRWVVDL